MQEAAWQTKLCLDESRPMAHLCRLSALVEYHGLEFVSVHARDLPTALPALWRWAVSHDEQAHPRCRVEFAEILPGSDDAGFKQILGA